MSHEFRVETRWTGNRGSGTSDYRAYSRDHEVQGPNKLGPILGSSDPAFRGDGTRYNPEELLVASLSACHMLWYLHLCADAGIVVTEYVDAAIGWLSENKDGSGEFTRVVLRPRVLIADGERAGAAMKLHDEAHRSCFIARSVNFPVEHEPVITACDSS